MDFWVFCILSLWIIMVTGEKLVRLWRRFFRRLVEANRWPGFCQIGKIEHRSLWTHPAFKKKK